jgi:hypothetical protein
MNVSPEAQQALKAIGIDDIKQHFKKWARNAPPYHYRPRLDPDYATSLQQCPTPSGRPLTRTQNVPHTNLETCRDKLAPSKARKSLQNNKSFSQLSNLG